MDAGTAKKLIEKNLSYDEVRRLTIKLVQHASPQTQLLEAEPQVLALISDVVKPELEASGLKPVIDRMGNLILHVKGRERTDRLMLVGYAMCAAPSTMQDPYSGAIVRRRALQARWRMRLGARRMRTEGEPGGDAGGRANSSARARSQLPTRSLLRRQHGR